jgi:transposase
MKPLDTTLPDDPAEMAALLVKQQAKITKLEGQIHSLLESLRLGKHRLYSASSEKAPGQAELFDEPEETTTLTEDTDVAVATTKSTPKASATRKPLPKDLPRVQHVYELPVDERQCPCGCELTEIGEDGEWQQERKKSRKLEKERNRKDKALAEAAALLVLQKKARAIWGDSEDD